MSCGPLPPSVISESEFGCPTGHPSLEGLRRSRSSKRDSCSRKPQRACRNCESYWLSAKKAALPEAAHRCIMLIQTAFCLRCRWWSKR
eukprot:2875158-Prymnesium_polylepis.1